MKPKLRFKEFSDEWEEKKFLSLFDLIIDYRGKTPKKLGFDWGGNIPALSALNVKDGYIDWQADIHFGSSELCDIWMKEPLAYNDILFTMEAPLGNVALVPDNKSYILSQRVIALRTKQNYPVFIFQMMRSNFFQSIISKLSTGTTAKGINQKGLNRISVLVPSLPEQEKIGQFLSLVDKRIEKQEQRIELLKERKKGWMQKIFNQEIRFKDENGNDYPDWEEKKLGDIGDTFNGLSGKTKDDFGHGEAKFITFVNVLNHPIAKKSGVDCIEIDSKQNEVKYGDFLFTTSSETPQEVGMSSLWLNKEPNVYLNSFCFGYRLKEDSCISYTYMAYLLRSESVRKSFIKLAQGISRYNISKKKSMEILVSFPSLPEQEKIAGFLSKQDELIEQEEKKLELLKEQKKGLLQQMFV